MKKPARKTLPKRKQSKKARSVDKHVLLVKGMFFGFSIFVLIVLYTVVRKTILQK